MDTERQLILRIARRVPSRLHFASVKNLTLGIGDDAAILSPLPESDWVITCDSFLENIHFLANAHPAESVGYKSLARAASDIAAMGATPRWFLLALALPASKTGSWLDRFSSGMGRAARALGLSLIGGDTTKSPSLFISITVLGEIPPGRAVTRSGARPGDLIYVSDTLGEAALGLAWIRSRSNSPLPNPLPAFLRRHLYPRIPVALGSWLASRRIASSMMDISDGLSTDLSRLCSASRVGARLDAAKIPIVSIPHSLPSRLRRAHLHPLALALHGGDDYALLFTVPPPQAAALRRAPGARSIRCIGEITRSRKLVLVNSAGKSQPLVSGGWDPFASR